MTSQESFDRLAFWKDNFLKLAQPPNAASFPFVVCGNKTDGERVVTAEAARAWCSANGGYDYFETSATTGNGVETLFTRTGTKALSTVSGDDDDAVMPASLSGAAGAIKIDRETEKEAEKEKTKKKKKCKC